MTSDEILGQLPKLTEEEKRQLWDILNQQLADEREESPEFIAEREARSNRCPTEVRESKNREAF